jgi:hypothetical protein
MPFVSSPPGSSRVISASGGDDYATAQAAINASIVDGKTIVVRGILRLSAGLIIENAVNGITMMGATGGSGFIPYDAAADAITLLTERVTAGNGGYHTVIQDLLFKSRKAHSAPGADSGGTIGFVTSSSWGTHIRNCAFFYCKTAIICSNSYGGAADANGNQVTAIERIKIFGPHIDSGPQVLGASDEQNGNANLQFIDYKVQKGDTLFNLSQKYNISWTTLATLNNLESPFTLNRPGKLLPLSEKHLRQTSLPNNGKKNAENLISVLSPSHRRVQMNHLVNGLRNLLVKIELPKRVNEIPLA